MAEALHISINTDIALGFLVGFIVGAFVTWWRSDERKYSQQDNIHD